MLRKECLASSSYHSWHRRRAHLDDFVASYHAENRHVRVETERFCAFSYDDLLKREMSLDLAWLCDDSLEGADCLPAPDILAASIAEDIGGEASGDEDSS